MVAAEFGKDRIKERLLLAKLAYDIDPRIEVHPVGLYEYEDWNTIIHEIASGLLKKEL